MPQPTCRIAALYRYPVKSMLGEALESALIDGRGVVGDRTYAVVDPAENRVGSAKVPRKWAKLCEFSARFATNGAAEAGTLPPPLITFPDGRTVGAEDPDIHGLLSEVIGRPVRLVSQSPEGLKFEAAAPGADPISLEETADYPVLTPFFDLASLHLVSTSGLAYLRSSYPEGDFDERRFRPNIVIEAPEGQGFLEETWIAKTVMLGEEVRLRILGPTRRCAATTLPRYDLRNDPQILRTAGRQNKGNVGVYAIVLQGGLVRIGDEVQVMDA